MNIAGMRLDARAIVPPGERRSSCIRVGRAFGGAASGNSITSENIVDWGGAKELGRDNYYITEDSAPAKLGARSAGCSSSTGTTLRNAFLNSPGSRR